MANIEHEKCRTSIYSKGVEEESWVWRVPSFEDLGERAAKNNGLKGKAPKKEVVYVEAPVQVRTGEVNAFGALLLSSIVGFFVGVYLVFSPVSALNSLLIYFATTFGIFWACLLISWVRVAIFE